MVAHDGCFFATSLIYFSNSLQYVNVLSVTLNKAYKLSISVLSGVFDNFLTASAAASNSAEGIFTNSILILDTDYLLINKDK